jgi:hypothetical protein
LRTLQRKLTRFLSAEDVQTLREEAFNNTHHRRMLNLKEKAFLPFSRRRLQGQGSESVPARICGNCRHVGFHVTRSRGISALRWLCQNGNLFTEDQTSWTPRMVSTVEDVVKVYGWRSFCKKENAHVTMFEEACASFFPHSFTCAHGPREAFLF